MLVNKLIATRILVCIANPHLARNVSLLLTSINTIGATSMSELMVITRDETRVIDPDRIDSAYRSFVPRLVVFDPYRVEFPFVVYDDSSPHGFKVAEWFDNNPAVNQVVFTAYPEEELPSLPNSPIIPQGKTMPELIETVVSLSVH